MKYASQPQTCRIYGLAGHFVKDCPKSQKEAGTKKAQPEGPESKSKGKSPESKDMPMETQSSTSQVTQAEIMDTPCAKKPVQEDLEELHATEPDPDVLHSYLDDVIGSVSTDEDDIHSVDSLDEDQDNSPALPKQDLAQATKAWADAKDEAERKAGLKPCCPLCRTDSHTEGQCVAARIRQACKRKSSAGEDSKPGNVSIRKKNFKRFKADLQQVLLQAKNTDDVQYVLETDGYSHLFACYLLSVFGTFTEGQKSDGHLMAGNAEVMDLWAKFSNERMTKVAVEEHLMMAYERI